MLFNLKKTVQQKKKKFKLGKPFNPNFDGNLLAWYDGDTLNTDPANTWSDRSANGYDLTLVNNPTIINNALNGHDALQFDGVNQYADRALTPAQNQPITKYLVFKHITFTVNDTIYDSNNRNSLRLYQNGISPDLVTYSGVNSSNLNPQIALNVYDILTALFNGVTSENRVNNNIAVGSNIGANNGTGITLAAFGGGLSTWSNTEIAYYIIRQGADSTATQNLFINYLKNRFGI